MHLEWIYREAKHVVVQSCSAGTTLLSSKIDLPEFEISNFTCSLMSI